MRFLLSVAFVAAATGLLCHGVFKEEEAQASLRSAGSNDQALRQVIEKWPYSQAAVDARSRRLDRWIQEKKPAENAPFFPQAYARVHDGFGDTLPWVDPFAAAGIGLAGLVLALFMPGTRFRGLALMLVLAGLVAAAPAFLEPGQQVAWVEKVELLKHPLGQFPRVALALVFLAGLVIGPRHYARRD